MKPHLSVQEALATLKRSSLPTVLTEGSDDYRVMRKLENRLTDIGVDFLPLGGRDIVLQVWSSLPAGRAHNTVALVDLDKWIYIGVPHNYMGNNLLYTLGYSIENDILIDHELTSLLDPNELLAFKLDLDLICAEHAVQVEAAKSGNDCFLKRHVNEIIAAGDVSSSLSPQEQVTKQVLLRHYTQMVRGKTVFELLVRQLSRPGRFAKFGYKQLYEIGSAHTGGVFSHLERDVRDRLS